jgi:hypothetical protein
MLFAREHRNQLLERSRLHRILQGRSWIFGEQYAVVVSDKGLITVLEEHRKLLGHEPAPVTPIRTSETGGAPHTRDLYRHLPGEKMACKN